MYVCGVGVRILYWQIFDNEAIIYRILFYTLYFSDNRLFK